MGRLNKPAKEGYNYRSPNQTNAQDITPNLLEDVVASQNSDLDRIVRSNNESPAQTEARRKSYMGNVSQRDAAGRAMLRSMGRAGLAGNAFGIGSEVGRYIDEKTGAGKKIVDKSGLGDLVDKFVNTRDKVELSPNSKARLSEMEVDKARRDSEEENPKTFKRGGTVKSASNRGDGIARRGKTRGRMV
jgi:hypothetical protein